MKNLMLAKIYAQLAAPTTKSTIQQIGQIFTADPKSSVIITDLIKDYQAHFGVNT